MVASTARNERVTRLLAEGVPFVEATVVRAQQPTSAQPGDAAVVLADGRLEGFVGGQCAEGSVVTAALEVLRTGEPLLLRVLPDDDPGATVDAPDAAGERRVVNPCLSGGAIEVFLEPHRPPAAVVVAGTSPVARALVATLEGVGFAVRTSDAAAVDVAGALAVVVSTHGRDEPDLIRAALAADVPFVGLVASERRAAAVLEAMDLSADERRAVRSPVGLEIGARTPEEIAVSIAAELVRDVRLGGLVAPEPPAAPATAVDPVCGMTVTITPDTPHLTRDGEDVWFCATGCRDRYAADLVGSP